MLSDCLNRFGGNFVPRVAVRRRGHFVQKLKGNHVFVLCVALGELFPQSVKMRVKLFVGKKIVLVFASVKRIAQRFVQVQNQVQLVFFCPENRVVNVAKTALDKRAVLALKNLPVNRHANMVKPPSRGLFKIAFRDERLVMLVRVFPALRKPSAKINAFFVANKILHKNLKNILRAFYIMARV